MFTLKVKASAAEFTALPSVWRVKLATGVLFVYGVPSNFNVVVADAPPLAVNVTVKRQLAVIGVNP